MEDCIEIQHSQQEVRELQILAKHISTFLTLASCYSRSYGEFNKTVQDFQKFTVEFIRRGYDGSSIEDRWTFSNSLMFALSIITTIG